MEAALRKGVVLVAPAGDNGAGTDAANYPAAYPGVISVGAFNSSFTKAAFSSHQPYVTLTAPGDGVISASGTAGYAKLASTTAASAVVAGIAALIRAQFPALSPAQVEQALTSGTVFHPAAAQRAGSGAGTADADAALVAAARIYATMTASQAHGEPGDAHSPGRAEGGGAHHQPVDRAALPGAGHRGDPADRGRGPDLGCASGSAGNWTPSWLRCGRRPRRPGPPGRTACPARRMPRCRRESVARPSMTRPSCRPRSPSRRSARRRWAPRASAARP